MNIYKNPTVLVEERLGISARLIQNRPQINVYDFGCGPGGLGMQLWKSDKLYFPHDAYPAFPGVTIVDFNKIFPTISTPRADSMCACLGIFEYILDVPAFIDNIAKSFSVVVFSYLDLNKIILEKNGIPQGIAPLLNSEHFIRLFTKHYSTVVREATIGSGCTLQNVYYAH